jgi:tRNA-intron endonuclease
VYVTLTPQGGEIGVEGYALYEQSGYGRKTKKGLIFAPIEILYLVYRDKIQVHNHSYDSLLAYFAKDPSFFRLYLVYQDMRERGYAIQTGPHDFRVFKRGQRPGKGESYYMMRVVSERDLIDFQTIQREIKATANMRKQHILAAVDDEGEITYYDVQFHMLKELPEMEALESSTCHLAGIAAIVYMKEGSGYDEAFYGKRLDESRIMLSTIEALYLANNAVITLTSTEEENPISADDYYHLVHENDAELPEKYIVYCDLKKQGYIPKTGYKFGHHFRVYAELKTHSEMLVQAIPNGHSLVMNSISRSVRMAHSVRKKMLFACLFNDTIMYIEFRRVKM